MIDVSKQLALGTPNALLSAVRAYLDLISPQTLTYGNGLKRLFVITRGVATFDPTDVEGITNKAVRMGLVPHSLGGFMRNQIALNCATYATLLHDVISQRLVMIANGDVRAPKAYSVNNTVKARQQYYLPPSNWLASVQDALVRDFGNYQTNGDAQGYSRIRNCANDATLLMQRFSGSEGALFPTAPAWGLLSAVCVQLTEMICEESAYVYGEIDYQRRIAPGLRCLWFIAKLLLGDLSTLPQPYEVNQIDASNTINMTDGTLAAVPLPLRQTVGIFQDDIVGLSMKGRIYIGAVAAASFFKRPFMDDVA